MKIKKKVLIFIVAYNAELTLERLLQRFPKNVISYVEEIILADDASSDRTFEVALSYKKKNKIEKLKVLKHKNNLGYGGNQKYGYNYAIKNNFDIVVMVHGDCQYPPELILDLIRPLEEEKSDFVFGSRISGNPIKGGMPIYKFIGNKFLTSVENTVLNTNLSEFHSGFRAYSTYALKEIPFNRNSNDFHFDSEIIVQLKIANKKISEITIPTCYGDEKCNVNSLKYGINILRIMSQYLLHRTNIKKYDKFIIKNCL